MDEGDARQVSGVIPDTGARRYAYYDAEGYRFLGGDFGSALSGRWVFTDAPRLRTSARVTFSGVLIAFDAIVPILEDDVSFLAI